MAAAAQKIVIESSAFKHSKPIPRKYTCEGEDVSPPLTLSGIPPNAKTLALIVDDPDAPAGDWVHWVAWNIDPKLTSLEEGAALQNQGKNDFGKSRYQGPCPPRGKPHRYFFKIYALDTALELSNNITKSKLLSAMSGHILAQGELIGTYERK